MALTGNNTSTYTQDLIGVGTDAFTNLYKIKFTGGVMGQNDMLLRVRSGNFTPPVFTQTTNKYHYMTVDVDMPKAEYTGTKEFTLKFRVDENYLVYKNLLKQKGVTSISNLGGINVNIPDSTGSKGSFKTSVNAYDGKGMIGDTDESHFKELYTFDKCWVKSIRGLTFSYDNSSPITVEAIIGFQSFDDPENLLIKNF